MHDEHTAQFSWLWIAGESGVHIGCCWLSSPIVKNGTGNHLRPMCHACVTGLKHIQQPAICDWSLAARNTTKWVSMIRPREEARFSDTHVPRKCDYTLSEDKWHVSKKRIACMVPLSYDALCAENRWATHRLQFPYMHVLFATVLSRI